MTDEDRVKCMDADMREWFEVLTPERRAVITARMAKIIEATVGEWDDNTDPVLVETAFIEVADMMCTQDSINELVAEGVIRVSCVSDSGDLCYTAVVDKT